MDTWVTEPSSIFTTFVLLLMLVDIICVAGGIAILVKGI